MEFSIIRSPNKEEIRAKVLEMIFKNDFCGAIGYNDMRVREFVVSLMKLRKMLEVADEIEIGFAAFFKGPSGQWYYISNVNHLDG